MVSIIRQTYNPLNIDDFWPKSHTLAEVKEVKAAAGDAKNEPRLAVPG